MATPRIPAGATFAFDVGIAQLESQFKRIDALDTKAAVVLGVDGVLAGLLLSRQGGQALPGIIATVVFTALAWSFFLGLAAFWTQRYKAAPAPKAVASMMMRGEDWLKWRFLGNVLLAHEINSSKLEWKVTFLKLSMIGLALDVVVLSAFLLLSSL